MDILQFTFMQRALISATLIGGLCALIGVYVVLRSMSFIGAGIAHASFGGVALGFILGVNPFFTTMLFSTATAWAIAFVSEGQKIREDTAVGIFFASTMAFGVLLIGFMHGYNVDLFSYIFGNILSVSRFDVLATCVLGLVVVFFIVLFYKEFLLLTFDQEMARVVGLPVRVLNLLMLTLVAVTIVVSIKSVGVVLVSALIVTPAAAAFLLTEDFKKMMLVSVAIGIGSSWLGLLISTLLNLASGAAIVMTATLIFFLCFIFSPQRRLLKQRMLRLTQGIIK
jgi:ABC-type Mn2+/Zn2+ transport system permease subunit